MGLDDERQRLEEALDELLRAIPRPGAERERLFRSALAAAVGAFEAEERAFDSLAADYPAVVSKMRGQHAQARELAAAVEDGMSRGAPENELARLLRGFHAIVQHNVIEEGRDLFRRR